MSNQSVRSSARSLISILSADMAHRIGKELEHDRIERALAGLEDAVRRCREEDVRYGTGISAALSFLELRANEKWPFEEFRKALEDSGMEGTKPEARWQMLNASLNAIKWVIRKAALISPDRAGGAA